MSVIYTRGENGGIIPTDFTKTKDAAESANQAFSEKLTELFKAREKAREKRKRTAEKVAVGHALGDLFGALGAHFVSGVNNSQAVVAQPLAPKSYEKVQSLINEGVADQNTFDQYMLSLTQKKGEQDVAIAQAEDKAAIEAAKERNRQKTAALKLQAEKDAEERQRTWQADQNDKDRTSAERIAQIRATASGRNSKNSKTDLTSWQRIVALAMAPKENTSTTVESGGVGVGNTTRTTTSAYEPNETSMKNLYARAVALAKFWGITLDEQGSEKFIKLYNLIGKKRGNVSVVTKDQIKKALSDGYTVEQIEKHLK